MGLLDTLINHMQNRRQAELAFALSQREDAEAEAKRQELLGRRGGFDQGEFARALDNGTVLMPDTPISQSGLRFPMGGPRRFIPNIQGWAPSPAQGMVSLAPQTPASERVGMLQRIRDRMKTTRGNMSRGMGYLYQNSRDPFQRYPQLQAGVPGTPQMESEQYQPRQYADVARPRYY